MGYEIFWYRRDFYGHHRRRTLVDLLEEIGTIRNLLDEKEYLV